MTQLHNFRVMFNENNFKQHNLKDFENRITKIKLNGLLFTITDGSIQLWMNDVV